MSDLIDRVLGRLSEAGFRVARDPLEPFQTRLPLVSGWGWDPDARMLVLVAYSEDSENLGSAWRELLFATAGLRHFVAEGRPSAIGTPVVLAAVPTWDQEAELRNLAEDLGRDYALFERVDLNILPASWWETESAPSDQNLDGALAPLLLKCRKALADQEVIGPEVLEQFAVELREQTVSCAERLDDSLAEHAKAVSREIGDRLVASLGGAREGASDFPLWSSVRLKDFRAFRDLEVPLKSVTVLEGLNGTGKSSLFEALEVLWTGTSQRRPAGKEGEGYGAYLRRGGERPFEITGTNAKPRTISNLVDGAAPLSRNYLAQDTLRNLVDLSEADRYAQLLRMTGLRIPSLEKAREALNRDEQANLNALLSELGMETLPSIQSDAVKLVRRCLSAKVAPDAMQSQEFGAALEGFMQALNAVSGSYQSPDWLSTVPTDDLQRFDQLVDGTTEDLDGDDQLQELADVISGRLSESASAASQEAGEVQEFASWLRQLSRRVEARGTAPRPEPEPGITPSTAAVWLSTVDAIAPRIAQLEAISERIKSKKWQTQLGAFLEALRSAVEATPRDELSRIRPRSVPAPEAPVSQLDPALQARFGLPESMDSNENLQVAAERWAGTLRRLESTLRALAKHVTSHPAVLLRGREEELHHQLARYELARALRTPIGAAQQNMVERLVMGPLRPVLTELITALTRFEWYFARPHLDATEGRIRIAKLATESEELDVRFLLNSAERSIVGLAWFLSLHLLQTASQRKVLLMDDPCAGLDDPNRAAVISTLRAVLRLSRPGFLLVSSHDSEVARSLEEEFVPSDWPASLSRLRFAREGDGSIGFREGTVESPSPDVAGELEQLGVQPGTAHETVL